MATRNPLVDSLVSMMLLCGASSAYAFGDEGHEVIALVARANLTAQAKAQVDRLLLLDSDPIEMHDHKMTSDSFERQSTWADYFRDRQRVGGKPPEQIHSYFWHFADIEIHGGVLSVACFDFPLLTDGLLASDGADPDCVVNKIEQFSDELASPSVSDAEKLLALKFLMHFVGDVHQPLHTSDDFDRGGNSKSTTIDGGSPTPLHSQWDTTFVELIGANTGERTKDPSAVVGHLRTPTEIEKKQWLGKPQPRYWALESYALAQSYAYGALPVPDSSSGTPVYHLDAKYVENATRVTADQLNKAGYRLAAVLNHAFP